MRHALLCLALTVAWGCRDRTPPEPAAPRTQPLAPDGSLARALTSAPDRARVEVDLSTIRAALRVFRAEHGAWPGSIDELRLEGRLSYPADLAYDAGSGTVTSKAYPSL
jgi:hypothetical protein